MAASDLVISLELLVVLIWPGFVGPVEISFDCLLLGGRLKNIFCNFAVLRSADFISNSNQHASLVLPCPCSTHITPADVLFVQSKYISFLMISQHIYCVQLWEIQTSQLYRTTYFTNRPLPEYIETWFILQGQIPDTPNVDIGTPDPRFECSLQINQLNEIQTSYSKLILNFDKKYCKHWKLLSSCCRTWLAIKFL